MDILNRVREFCQKNSLLTKQDKIVVGVSGGPDSLVLLHLLYSLRDELDLTLFVAHLNHQLRPADALADEAFVKTVATAWKIPIFVDSRNIARLAKQRSQSLEETARQVRYTFLWQVADQTAATRVAVGHNADDQVETLLMHFLRGSGLAGLRGMLPAVDLATLHLFPEDVPSPARRPAPQLIRPLLEISRAEIEAYCRENNLIPRQDSSNQDTTFFRNRLRHELIPYLESYNPNIRQVIRRTAQVISADVEILARQLDDAWERVVRQESSEKIEFDLEQWLELPLGLKRATLRQAVQNLRQSLRDIGFEHIENAVNIVERRLTGLKATLPQGLLLTTSYQSFLIAAADLEEIEAFEGPQLAADQVIRINLPGITPLPDSPWQLRVELLPSADLSTEKIKQVGRWEVYLDAEVVGQDVVLRSRRPGDRYDPLGMKGHSQKVNEFMINQKIPVNRRDQIPLLISDEQILWICGYRPSERARLRATTEQLFHFKFEEL